MRFLQKILDFQKYPHVQLGLADVMGNVALTFSSHRDADVRRRWAASTGALQVTQNAELTFDLMGSVNGTTVTNGNAF